MRQATRAGVKWLIGGALTGAVACCGYAPTKAPTKKPTAARTSSVAKTPRVVPSYEPIQYNGQDSATPAQKAKYREIYQFALADMERRHVSAERMDQFLWQMHFFVPVQYKPVSCESTRKHPYGNAEVRDFGEMSRSMTAVFEKYRYKIVQFNKARVDMFINTRTLPHGQKDWDLLFLYSKHLEQYIGYYLFGTELQDRVQFLGDKIHGPTTGGIDEHWDNSLDRDFFGYKRFVCNENFEYKNGDGFKINYKYIYKLGRDLQDP